jgi:hypothetical protein
VPPDTDTVYTHPGGDGNNHVPSGGASGNYLKWSPSGVATRAGVDYANSAGSADTVNLDYENKTVSSVCSGTSYDNGYTTSISGCSIETSGKKVIFITTLRGYYNNCYSAQCCG